MTSVPPPPGAASPRRGIDWRRLGLVGALGVLLALAAVGVASLLDDPVGGAAPDEARPAVDGAVAGLTPPTTTTAPATTDPSNAQLPPFAVILDRPFPNGLSEGSPQRAVAGLTALLERGRTPRRLAELGAAYQRAGQVGKAEAVFREALKADPSFIPAQVGLAMVPGEDGSTAGLDRAQAGLAVLRRAHPGSQVVVFNQAWTALYRRDAKIALPALKRAARIDPGSTLGVISASLLSAANGNSDPSGP